MVSLLGIVMDGSAQNAGSTREDEETIRKITGEMTDRFNKHDAKAATRMHMPDADCEENWEKEQLRSKCGLQQSPLCSLWITSRRLNVPRKWTRKPSFFDVSVGDA
jgi:hypothetical protein